jgi:heme-degrading monooxygenase HmoA
MIARIWRGLVPIEKAEAYLQYLVDVGIRDYKKYPGNRASFLLHRRAEGRVHIVLLSLWDPREAIAAYAGPDIERAHYYPYDLECLIDPPPNVEHYDLDSYWEDMPYCGAAPQ